MSDPIIQLNEYKFDPRTGQLVGPDGTQAVTGLSARVLLCLIEAAPNTVSPQQLAKGAWRLDHVSEDTIAQRIALLRKVFGDDPKSPRFIRTLRGDGYALIADLEPRREDTSAQERSAWPFLLASLAAAIAIAALIWTFWDRATPEVGTPEGVQSQASADPVDALLERARSRLSVHDRAATRQAIALLETAQARAPDDPRVKTGLAFALTTEATKFGGNRVEEAETLARAAVEARPEYASSWHALGYALDAQGRVDEALSAYGEALALDPDDFAARSSSAFLMMIRGRLYEALSHDVTAVSGEATNLYGELQIARSLRLMGDDARARAFEARALLLNPGQPVVLAGLGEAALSRGEFDRVSAFLDRAQPDDQNGELARLAGRAALSLGDEASAIEALTAAGPAAHWDLVALRALSGEAPADAISLSPADTWPESRIRMAEFAAASGQTGEALALIHAAIDLGWRDKGLLLHSPFLQGVRDEPEFRSAIERIETQTAAQAMRLSRDEEVSAQLDAIIASSN